MPSRRAVIIGGAALAIGSTSAYGASPNGGLAHAEIFKVGLIARDEINTLDPAQAGTESPIGIVWNTHDRLVQIDSSGKIAPRLAEAWTVSDDRREWRFRIRKNVRFHAVDSQPSRDLKPDDVVYSLTRAVRIPGYGRTLLVDILPGVAEVAGGSAKAIAGLRVEGDEVVFALSKPFNFLLDRLATSFLSVVPSGTPDSGSPPLGTGAYALASFDQAGQKVILRRHTEGWVSASPDAPKAIEIRGIPSEALGAAELRSGGIDMAEFNSSALTIMQAQSQSSYRITEYDHSELRLIALNQTRAPFNGPQGAFVGQALNLGIDRAALTRRLGGGQPFGGPVPTPGFASKQFGLDRTRAQSLVAQLVPDARKLEMLVEPVDEARIIAELLVAQWQEIGLRVTPVYGRADFFPKAAGGEFQMALAYYGPYVPSAEQYLWMYRKGAIPIPNVMRFDDSDFEQAFETYVTSADEGAQKTAVDHALDRLLDRAPTVWIAKPPRLMATRQPLTITRSVGLADYASIRWS